MTPMREIIPCNVSKPSLTLTFAHRSGTYSGEQLRRADEPGRHLITMKRQCRTTLSDTFSFSSSQVTEGLMFRRHLTWLVSV